MIEHPQVKSVGIFGTLYLIEGYHLKLTGERVLVYCSLSRWLIQIQFFAKVAYNYELRAELRVEPTDIL